MQIKKLSVAAISLIEILLLSYFCVMQFQTVNATPIFSDDFESGSFSAWTGVSSSGTGTGMNVVSSPSPVHSGTYSANYTCTSSTGVRNYYKTITSPPATLYCLAYIYINATSTLTATTTAGYLAPFGLMVSGSTIASGIIFMVSSSHLYWGIRAANSVGSKVNTISSTQITTTGWYCVELKHVTSSSVGEEHLYVNGVDVEDLTGTNNSGLTTNEIFIGQASTPGAITWTCYFDDVVLDTSYINPMAPTYSSLTTSATLASTSCTFGVTWTDLDGLATTGGYIFGSNCTGTWTNQTWTAFSSNPQTVTTTATLSATGGDIDQYEWWANNTDTAWNNTGIQSITVTSPATVSVTFTSSPTGIGFITVNGTAETTPYTIAAANINDVYTIAANSPVRVSWGYNCTFSSWSDSGAQSHSYTVSTGATVTATFAQQLESLGGVSANQITSIDGVPVNKVQSVNGVP